MVKLTAETLALVGATGAADFSEKLSAFCAKAKENETAMAEQTNAIEQLQTLAAALRTDLNALKASAINAEQCDARIDARCERHIPVTTAAIESWSASQNGKKIIGAEASRITVEALAAVGVNPAKPSPAPAAGSDTPEQKAAALVAEGKYEEAYRLDKNAQAEFVTAKSYAAFMRNRNSVKITNTNRN